MGKPIISVKNVSVSYKAISAYSIKKSLLKLKKVNAHVVEAVKNVSFEVEEGDILGVIGKNGCGKSTLLKAIAGIFSPDKGTIDLHNHSISLLSIGVGFQRKLSGRENIILSGMLLGFSEDEIRDKMEDIIEFAELGKFIDMPVRTYSSGMFSKLAFSITVILETDIILVDEVLSVGDTKFKKKSFEKMKSLMLDTHRTVIIVSHSIDTLKKLCNKIMWMHDGKVKKIGQTEEILLEYEKFMS